MAADLNAGKLLFWILLYLVVIFGVVFPCGLGAAEYYRHRDRGTSMQNMTGLSTDYSDNLLSGPGYCSGTGSAMGQIENTWLDILGVEIACRSLNIDNEVNSTCNTIYNCQWVNNTDLVGLDHSDCLGTVNETYYNISGDKYEYCEQSTGLQTKALCDVFGCTWVQNSDITSSVTSSSLASPSFAQNIWRIFVQFSLFQFDLGLGFFNGPVIFFIYSSMMFLVFLCIYKLIPFL